MMLDSLVRDGFWFLPDDPEGKVAGSLRFDQEEGGVLTLSGFFPKIKSETSLDHEPQIILGVSSAHNEKITLLNCFMKQWNLTGNKTVYSVDKVFTGGHFPKREDIKIKELFIHYSYLDDWVCLSGISFGGDPSRFLKEGEEFMIKYKQPAPLSLTTNDTYTMWIIVSFSPPSLSLHLKEASIKQMTNIRLEFVEEHDLNASFDMVRTVQLFLSLAMNRPVYPLTIECTSELCKEVLNGTVIYRPVRVFYQIPGISCETKSLSVHDMFFDLSYVREDISQYLNNWIGKRSLLNPIYDLYFSTVYAPDMYLENKFLSIASALETYHRRTMNNLTWPEAEFNTLRDTMIEAVQVQYKDRLSQKLQYINEPSLRKRIKELFDKFSFAFKMYVKDRDAFAQDVSVTRNYLVHHDENMHSLAAHGEKLALLTFTLKYFLICCLLYEIGFSSTQINELLNRAWKYGMF